MQARNPIFDLFIKRYNVERKFLDLSSEKLNNNNMLDLCTFLNEHPEIEELDLSCNEINSEGAKILASHINIVMNTKLLYINNNNLGPDGAKHVVSMILANMPQLSHLKIIHCDLGFEGAKALAGLVNLNKLDAVLYYGSHCTKYGAEGYLTQAFSEKRKKVPSLLDLCLFKARSLKQTNPESLNKLPKDLIERINKLVF